MKTPSETSPWNFFQERYRGSEWRLLCCTIMLNVTTGRALEGVHRDFFRFFPDPESAAAGDPELMGLLLQPLGIQNVRASRIISMSRAYLTWDGVEVDDLPGIGRYGRDSHEIFIRGNLVHDVRDKELKRYVGWARERLAGAPAGPEEDSGASGRSDGRGA